MVFPTQLTDYLQPAVDKFTFTIAEDLDGSETGVDITGGTDAFEIPCIINVGDELMKATSKTSTTLTVTRDLKGDGPHTHTSGDAGYIPFSAEHYNELVDQKDAVLKYLCRNESSLPGSGTEYEMVEYNNEIYIYNGTGWELIGNITDHDDLKELGEGDPHPAYYTASEMTAAHDNIAGDHVIDGNTHDHLDGTGFGRLRNSTSAPSGTPSEGEIHLNTSTGVLYTGYGGSWSAVVGAPSGMIMPFDPSNLSSACPSGWSRYTALDEKFVKGTTAGSSSTGGSATHSHTFDSTDVVNHQHSIDSQSMNATGSESHTHQYNHRAGSGSNDGIYHYASTSFDTDKNTSSSGGHSHTGTMSNNTQSTGEASPSTDSANGEPQYQKVVWCQKD